MTRAETFNGGDDNESMIAALVKKILLDAAERGCDSIACPSLPDGEITEEDRPAADASLRALNDLLTTESDDSGLNREKPDPVVYYRKDGKWRRVMVLPADIMEAALDEFVVMAELPTRSRKPQEGVIRLKTPGGANTSFRLYDDPAAPRVRIDVMTMPG